MDINIELLPNFKWQDEVLNHPAKHKMIISSRQIGKTTLAKRVAIKYLLKGLSVLWLAPTFDQTKKIFESINETCHPIINYISTPKELRTITKGAIQFKSADNPDSLRSQNYNLVIL